MSVEEKVSKLEGLLARIVGNASKPRVRVVAAAAQAAPAAPQLVPEPEELDLDVEAAPAASAARVAVAPLPQADEPLELFEDDIVEISPEPADVAVDSEPPTAVGLEEPVRPAPDPDAFDIDFEDEEPPASSRRAIAASSMDEALADAALHLQDDAREVPIKTPPPESGPQQAPPASSSADDVDELLGSSAELGVYSTRPTAEQLGETIELEDPMGPDIELEAPALESSPVEIRREVEPLEASIPEQVPSGVYDENLLPPENAAEELQRRRSDTLDLDSPLAESAVIPVPEAGPDVIARPHAENAPVATFGVRRSLRPSTFLELLDGSLSL